VISKYEESRVGQQFGTLLAGYWHWQNETPITVEEAERLAKELFSWQKDKRGGDEKVDTESDDCLSHLLDLPVKIDQDRNVLTLNSILTLSVTIDEKNHALKSFGIKLCKKTGVFIANKNPALKKQFTNTPWPDWTRSLQRLPHVKQGRTQVGLAKPRGLYLPLEITAEDEY
jgi:hypothetical protein